MCRKRRRFGLVIVRGRTREKNNNSQVTAKPKSVEELFIPNPCLSVRSVAREICLPPIARMNANGRDNSPQSLLILKWKPRITRMARICKNGIAAFI